MNQPSFGSLGMAKKMNAKLSEYRADYMKEMGYEENRDYREDLMSRENKEIVLEMPDGPPKIIGEVEK